MSPAAVSATDRLVGLLHEDRPLRAWSIIVTIYGDAIVPRGGELGLGPLLDIAGRLGLNGGLIRTALTRLVADRLIDRNRRGRNSYYRLAPAALMPFTEAAKRIYFGSNPRWAGRWRMAILPPDAAGRDGVRDRLQRAGYGVLAPNVLIVPLPEDEDGRGGLPAEATAVVMAEASTDVADGSMLAGQAWRLDDLSDGYRLFIDRFGPTLAQLEAGEPLPDLDALAIRILAIHAFRRLVLRDPRLPVELLPAEWPGTEARSLCGSIYRMVRDGAERWLDANGRNSSGVLQPPDPSLYARFA